MAVHINGVNVVVQPDYDSIVVGAGFAGLRMIHELQNLNQTFKVIEAGSTVGGTWYWSRPLILLHIPLCTISNAHAKFRLTSSTI